MIEANITKQSLIALENLYQSYEDNDGDEEMMRILKAEIDKRKEDGVKFVAVYKAINNDTYEEATFTLLFYECPKNHREIAQLIKSNFDGVWDAVPNSITLYSLTVVL